MRRMTYEALIWLLKNCSVPRINDEEDEIRESERQSLIRRLEKQKAIDHEQGRL